MNIFPLSPGNIPQVFKDQINASLPEVPTPDMGTEQDFVWLDSKASNRATSVPLNSEPITALGHSVDFGRKPITLRSNSLDNKGK